MNGGDYSVRWRPYRNLYWSAASRDRRVLLMRKTTRVEVTIRINVAACLLGIAAIIKVLI